MSENVGSDDRSVVVDARGGQVHEIEMDKNYIVVLTFPSDADSRAADETCKHLAAMLARWAEQDYPDKFLVLGLRDGGMKIALHQKPIVEQTR